MNRLLGSLAIAATAALPMTGCGGSGGSDATPATEWANGFCSALSAWTSTMSSFTSELDSSGLSKDSLRSAAGDAKGATQTLANDLRALGTPDTQSADEVKDSLDRLSIGLKADISDVEQTVGDATGVTGVVQALPVIGETLATMGDRVRTALRELDGLDTKGELEDAFAQAPACAELTK